MNVNVEELIRQYVVTVTKAQDIEVEIIEDTVVLSRADRWHIYVIPGRFTMIGCFVDEDIDISLVLRENAPEIINIYEMSKEDESVQ